MILHLFLSEVSPAGARLLYTVCLPLRWHLLGQNEVYLLSIAVRLLHFSKP